MSLLCNREKIHIPTTLQEITKDWLNTILKPHKIVVEDFTILGDAKGNLGYLSSLNRLQLKVKTEKSALDVNQNQIEELNVIIKAVPSDPTLRSYVVGSGYCPSELQTYTRILPEFTQFLDLQGVSSSHRFIHPLCYYGAEEVGETPEDYKFILILEDLKASGYELFNGGEGAKKSFDWEHTEIGLKQIALFHASAVAYKLGRNDFEKYSDVFPKLFSPPLDDPMLDTYIRTGFEVAFQVIQDVPDEIPEGLVKQLEFLQNHFREIVIERVLTVNPKELNVIRHQDLHVNNVMFSYEAGVPVKAKWFDFQACAEGRPMLDLGFFLILNCLPEFSTTELKRSLRVYHETFMVVLEEAGLESKLPNYTLEKIESDFREYRLPSIMHIISGAPVWCTGPQSNQVSRDRLRKAIVYAYQAGELEWSRSGSATGNREVTITS